MSCPHCSGAFLDFEGCLAVECKCGLFFCGLCLEPSVCHDLSHTHVKQCKENLHPNSLYFGRGKALQEFNYVHGKRQKRLILLYLENKIPNKEERKEVKMLLKVDLEGKINLDD
jgi:hypothetical protein